MPTEELERALERRKIGDAEADYVEVVARVLRLTPAVVDRVLYAFQMIDGVLKQDGLDPFFRTPLPDGVWAQKIPNEELREAIRVALTLGCTRVRLARAILDGAEIAVDVESLLPSERAAELCRGCPEQLECLASSLSTPQQCFQGRKKIITIKPLRLTRAEVEAEARQPEGRQVMPLFRVKLRQLRKP